MDKLLIVKHLTSFKLNPLGFKIKHGGTRTSLKVKTCTTDKKVKINVHSQPNFLLRELSQPGRRYEDTVLDRIMMPIEIKMVKTDTKQESGEEYNEQNRNEKKKDRDKETAFKSNTSNRARGNDGEIERKLESN